VRAWPSKPELTSSCPLPSEAVDLSVIVERAATIVHRISAQAERQVAMGARLPNASARLGGNASHIHRIQRQTSAIDGRRNMTMHGSKLRGREQIAHGTMAFHFDKPAGFKFKPGQAIDVVLLEPPAGAAQSARHTFSIVSAPFENQLVITTRMRDSAFKRALGDLPVGASIAIEGPSGSLTLHNHRAWPAVFIAGGIGITPFMSIVAQATEDRLQQRLVLLYSNRRPEDAAYLVELQELERRNPHFRLVATMTLMSSSSQPWTGSRGLIDSALVSRAAAELAKPICYVAGPPGMVEALRQTLNDAGLDDDDIRSEEFYGY
jgi:ferredoxin-NADP reductase